MISFKAVVGVLFALLVIIIGGLVIVGYRYSRDRVTASGRVFKAYQAIAVTEAISSAYNDLRMSTLHTIYSDDRLHATPLEGAKAGLLARINELNALVENDERILADSLESAAVRFCSEVESLVRHLPAGGNHIASYQYTPEGAVTDEVASQIENVRHAHSNLLARRKAEFQDIVESFLILFAILIGCVILLLSATFLVIRHNFNKLLAAEDTMNQALQSEIDVSKLKSSFVTLASHEFRTPLTTILSSAFLLEKYSFGLNHDKAAKHLARIRSSVNNLTSILDEFLSVTKIEEGRIQPNIEEVDLPEFLGNICHDLQTFAKPGQTIHYSHIGVQEVKTDPVILGNIVRNIVTNSIKYSLENSPIYVFTHVNSRIHLTVKDCGIGIPASDQKHLFGRFYRASNAGAIQGTGLGLHIMRHYVEMLKGSVELESELGKGTTVAVTFDQGEVSVNDESHR